ncbi:MAG: hypothetical protein R2761_05340 [Acidimicrobiales bacterium]
MTDPTSPPSAVTEVTGDIVGTSCVGLVTGLALAELGHRVVCLDVDPVKVAALRRRAGPFHTNQESTTCWPCNAGASRSTTGAAEVSWACRSCSSPSTPRPAPAATPTCRAWRRWWPPYPPAPSW